MTTQTTAALRVISLDEADGFADFDSCDHVCRRHRAPANSRNDAELGDEALDCPPHCSTCHVPLSYGGPTSYGRDHILEAARETLKGGRAVYSLAWGGANDDGTNHYSGCTAAQVDLDWLERLDDPRGNRYRAAILRGLKVALRADAFAWPGGYPIVYVCDNGDTLCADCQTLAIVGEISGPVGQPDVYYEGPAIRCDHCNCEIESAYGDPSAPDSAPA